MPDAQLFRPNSPPVIHETIDQEAIVVNLETGSYYSLNSAATFIWNRLGSGAALDEISREVAETFAADPAAATEDVRSFVDRLLDEGLVVARENGAPPAADREAFVARGAYEPPRLDHYTDMQELLLLDPVHEVDPTGWPARR